MTPNSNASAHEVEKRFLDIHEAANILDVSETEFWDIVNKHEIAAHNIGGTVLRFKQDDIEALKNKWRIERDLFPEKTVSFPHASKLEKSTLLDDAADFWYFNDFYIICSVFVAVLVYFIIASQ